MPIIWYLYGNLGEHRLKFQKYKRNGNDKKKISLALKSSSSFNEEEDELNEFESKDEEDEMALLSEKLQKILREKKE